ncbi:hypothetical protein GCM10007049_32780 [Echinicola pacifica]|uniref:Sulfite dehydrogenase (Cytochrome) subunit SorB n=1 Tax=Echinicola pacifica TaxID=346377 RepID=A0A918Q818_9BACT|nr:hypothetical protein [Echinicola pacifica]GGZ36849.1 hypothetical protein GCM10007049_32780 [Echinicola pacifica]
MDKQIIEALKKLVGLVLVLALTLCGLIGGLVLLKLDPEAFSVFDEEVEKQPAEIPEATFAGDDLVKDGVHVATGFVAKDGYETVIANCTNCHSANLITQNRGDEARWRELIAWMQETQGLWDLGANEDIIVSYLSEYYAPVQRGRRPNLQDIEWYPLND